MGGRKEGRLVAVDKGEVESGLRRERGDERGEALARPLARDLLCTRKSERACEVTVQGPQFPVVYTQYTREIYPKLDLEDVLQQPVTNNYLKSERFFSHLRERTKNSAQFQPLKCKHDDEMRSARRDPFTRSRTLLR